MFLNSLKKESILATYGIITVGIAILAFQFNRIWFLLMAVYTVMNAFLLWYLLSYTITLCIVFGIGALLPINWLITELFFDPTELGINQIIFAWVVSILLSFIMTWLGIKKVIHIRRERAANLACKRDAKNKYKLMLEMANELKNKGAERELLLNDLFAKIEKLQ